MKRFLIYLFSISLLCSSAFAETAREKAYNTLLKMPTEKKIELMQRSNARGNQKFKKYANDPKVQQFLKSETDKVKLSKTTESVLRKDGKVTDLPEIRRTPGEFEEDQAVFISWPSYAYDSLGNSLDPFYNGYGFYYPDDTSYEIRPIAGWILDVFGDSPYPVLWSKLANAIQNECKVLIRVTNISDTVKVRMFMDSLGLELNNCRFLYNKQGENAFWARDFGPQGFYFTEKDSLALINYQYYPGRPIDDDLPYFIASYFGYPTLTSEIELEGGNFMTDGYGLGFYSDVIYDNNMDSTGYAYNDKDPMTIAEVDEGMSNLFKLDRSLILPKLQCDGGTGHIDLYLKEIDEETVLTNFYPSKYNKTAFPDYATSLTNVGTVVSTNSTYGRPFKIKYIPLPKKDNGSDLPTSCNAFFNDARTYINGLIVNKSFIYPSFSNDTSGSVAADSIAKEAIQKHLPGYKLVPIDSRLLSPMGGAIHCITMQIPTDNPAKIWHPSFEGFYAPQNEFKFVAKVINKSGAKSATLVYRKNGGEWITSPMTLNAEQFEYVLAGANLVDGDYVDYYIQGETNNGKIAKKPFTAPDGYITFRIGTTGVNEEEFTAVSAINSIYPNPASEMITVNFTVNLGNSSSLTIVNSLGAIVGTVYSSMINAGEYNSSYNVSGLSAGTYFVKLQIGSEVISKPFTVVR